jgi:hypothetical protein
MLQISQKQQNKCKAFYGWNTYHEWEFYFLQIAKEKIPFANVLSDYTKTIKTRVSNNIIWEYSIMKAKIFNITYAHCCFNVVIR